jgi:hypothetical protein
MPEYVQRSVLDYRSLSDYLERRINEVNARDQKHQINPRSLSLEMGWAESYLSGIINGQYRPSRKRCVEIAERFGDDPNIILALAGFYVPQPDDPVVDEYMARLNNLSPESRRKALEYLDYLKYQEDSQIA